MKIKPFPLTSASFSVSALAAMLALSACGQDAQTTTQSTRAKTVAVTPFTVDGAALISNATRQAQWDDDYAPLHDDTDDWDA